MQIVKCAISPSPLADGVKSFFVSNPYDSAPKTDQGTMSERRYLP